MMEKYFANYNQSLALKELGFNEPCIAYYSTQDDFKGQFVLATSNCQLELMAQAPLKSQVFEWFRDKYKLHCSVHYNSLTNKYRLDYIKDINSNDISLEDLICDDEAEFKKYEEAESHCIDELIKIVKNGNSI